MHQGLKHKHKKDILRLLAQCDTYDELVKSWG